MTSRSARDWASKLVHIPSVRLAARRRFARYCASDSTSPRRAVCPSSSTTDVLDHRAGGAGDAALEADFYDMQHSNNAARIRLWRSLKTGMDDAIERRVVAYPDLKSPEFAAINPLKKVPAFIRADGTCVFESAVILDYLEDLYADAMPSFKPPTTRPASSCSFSSGSTTCTVSRATALPPAAALRGRV